jgi:hypothetical protein
MSLRFVDFEVQPGCGRIAPSDGGTPAGSNRLGIGSGIAQRIARLGTRYRPLAALADAVQIVRGLLRHETVTYRGRAFSADRVALEFAAPRPDMPIHLASDGRPQSRAVRPSGGRTDRVEPLPPGLHRPRGRDRPGKRRGGGARVVRLFILRHDDLLDVTGNATAGSRAVGGDCRICLKKSHQLFRFPYLRLDKFLRTHLARPSRVERGGSCRTALQRRSLTSGARPRRG